MSKSNTLAFSSGSAYSNLLGAAASGLCAVHCAVTPLLFAAKPIMDHAHGAHGHAHGNPLWGAFDYIFLALSLVAVWYSVRRTDHATLKKVLWASWGVFAAGILFEAFHLPYGHWLMYGGSLTLVVAHIMNYQHCRRSGAAAC